MSDRRDKVPNDFAAQELIYDAWETRSRKKRIELAKEALRLWPDCADAYSILAEDEAQTIEQARECYEKAVLAGERALGSDGFEEFKGHFWGFIETRPYMRARAGGVGAGGSDAGPMDNLKGEIGKFIEGKSFGSLEQLQAETDRFMAERNTGPMDDFEGLSTDQMHWFLYRAFDPGSPILFNTNSDIPADVPFLRLFMPLIREIGDGPLKTTGTGNLPLKVVRQIARDYLGESYLADMRRGSDFRSELDFMTLHVVRLLAGMGGFIKKRYQRFSLTKRGESFLSDGISGEAFQRLFQTYAVKFNWGYRDWYPELPIVQRAAFFALYLLQKFGDEDRPLSFYEDRFLRAFPAAVGEVAEREYISREEAVRRCFNLRAMDRFAHFFGFMEYAEKESSRMIMEDRVVRKTPFLDDWVSFKMD